MLSKAKAFSHVYVEEAAREHLRTRAILQRFPKSEVVFIDDYQNVFGRGRQDFWKQKASPKLILALKKDNFLYAGNDLLHGGKGWLANQCLHRSYFAASGKRCTLYGFC